MARSAREVIDEHVWGGQAKLVRYRKQYDGSGHYVPPSKYGERDTALLESLLNAQDLLEQAQFGPNDMGFRAALQRWAAGEWGGFFERDSMKRYVQFARPEPRQNGGLSR